MPPVRRRLVPVAAGSGVLAVLALGACGIGSDGSTAATSTVPSTAFRTIPVSPPKPTEPTTATPATGPGTANTAPATTLEPGVRAIYTVKAGDAPAGIAHRFDVPLDALYALNGINPSKPAVYVGQKLKIPRILPPTTVLPSGEKAYKVVAGDSPLGIAGKFGVSLQSLIDLNGWDPNAPAVYVGQFVKIPG